MAHPDPFQNTDPQWEPFDPTAASRNADLSMPDETASGLRSFLRSDEATKIIAAAQPQPPAPAREPAWRLASIPGFPK